MTDREINFSENKEELLKMKQVSALIQEVRPYFLNERKKQKARTHRLKIACAAVFLLFFGIGSTALNYEYDIVNSLVYHNLSAQEMGFPTDEYGLLMVE